MKPTFDIQPLIGCEQIKLHTSRDTLLSELNQSYKTIKKYPEREQASDALFRNDLHISYQGQPPLVESIEFAYSELYDVTLLGESILSLPAKSALTTLESATEKTAITSDGGYTYEIPALGLWLWRESNDNFDENGFYFLTIGIRVVT